MKNIHILPTNKTSSLYFEHNNSELIFLKGYFVHKNFDIKPHNIYITSDEEIKDGDWFMDITFNNYGEVYKSAGVSKSLGYENWIKSTTNIVKEPITQCKKIILTTDQDLIKDGVQAINDEFLEWFVKNPSCEWVDVWLMNKGYNKQEDYPYQEHYLIIIPKEETKKKHKVIIVGDGLPKQETLEEELLQQIKFCLISKNDSQAIRLLEKYAFEKQQQIYNDLKLQQEQIYNQIKQLHDNENITGFSKRAYAQCLDIVEHFKKNNKWK